MTWYYARHTNYVRRPQLPGSNSKDCTGYSHNEMSRHIRLHILYNLIEKINKLLDDLGEESLSLLDFCKKGKEVYDLIIVAHKFVKKHYNFILSIENLRAVYWKVDELFQNTEELHNQFTALLELVSEMRAESSAETQASDPVAVKLEEAEQSLRSTLSKMLSELKFSEIKGKFKQSVIGHLSDSRERILTLYSKIPLIIFEYETDSVDEIKANHYSRISVVSSPHPETKLREEVDVRTYYVFVPDAYDITRQLSHFTALISALSRDGVVISAENDILSLLHDNAVPLIIEDVNVARAVSEWNETNKSGIFLKLNGFEEEIEGQRKIFFIDLLDQHASLEALSEASENGDHSDATMLKHVRVTREFAGELPFPKNASNNGKAPRSLKWQDEETGNPLIQRDGDKAKPNLYAKPAKGILKF